MTADSDAEYEWHEVLVWGRTEPLFFRGRCLHREVVPVDLVLTGEVVARLCCNCWAQLPA